MRNQRWIGVSVLVFWAMGCQVPDDDGSQGATADGGQPVKTDNIVYFGLTTGVSVPILATLPKAASVHLRVRTLMDTDILSLTHADFPAMDHGYLYGLQANATDAPSVSDGSSAILPRGYYFVEAFAPDASPVPLSCDYTRPEGTRTITLIGNLDSRSLPTTFDPTHPMETSNFMTKLTLWNTLGVAFPVEIFYVKSLGNTGPTEDWTYHVLCDGKYLSNVGIDPPAIPGQPIEIAGGVLHFIGNGQLASHEPDPKRVFVPAVSIKAQPLEFAFQGPTSSAEAVWDRFTHLPMSSELRRADQDGHGGFVHCAPVKFLDGASPTDLAPVPMPSLPQPQVILQQNETPSLKPEYYDIPNLHPVSPTACVCKLVESPFRTEVAAHVPPPGESADQTKALFLRGNLDVRAVGTQPFDLADPKHTSNFSTSAVVKDIRGNDLPLILYFSKLAEWIDHDSGDWLYHVVGSAQDLETSASVVKGDAVLVASGMLRFDTEGRLVENIPSANLFHPKGAARPQALDFRFGNSTATKGNGLDGLTQYAAESFISYTEAIAAYPRACLITRAQFDPKAYGCWEVEWP